MPPDDSSPPRATRTSPRNDLTAAEARRLLAYDPATGVLTWNVTRGGTARAGSVAGNTDKGYRLIIIRGHRYRAHRLAWLITYGRWPADQLDHINGAKDDNRLANLREASNAENLQNLKRALATNKLGVLGVSRHRNQYRADIVINGEKWWLGYFDTAEEAAAHYRFYKRLFHDFWSEGDTDTDDDK